MNVTMISGKTKMSDDFLEEKSTILWNVVTPFVYTFIETF